ncbi:MAG: DNA polymerase III subunit beta [Alphaproteobacteria bacterium]
MKFTIERNALLKALAHVQSVVERRNTIPILSNVLIETANNALHLTATDLEIAVIETAEASAGQDGAITAPAHTLYDIVRKLPDGADIEFDSTTTDGRIALRAGRSQFALSSLPKDDFPVMADGDLPNTFDVSADELKRLIDRTRFAISTEETRYYLNGIYLHAADEGGTPVLRAVATDGHRLAQAQCELPDGAANMPGVIVPRKTVAEIRKLLDEVTGSVTIALSETKIRFTVGSVTLTSKLIDGTFPDYERVIPKGNDRSLVVSGDLFAAAVDRVSTISTEKSRAVKLKISEGLVELSANSPDAGSAVEEVAAEFESEPLEIGFNAKYLLDITGQISGDNAEFILGDSNAPTIVRDAADQAALYVLMPMRV